MRSKDIDNLENILLDLEDVENGGMISLSQGEINSLESILETLKESISKDKIREKIKEIESYAFTSKEEKNQQDYAIERIRELLEEN